MSVVDEFKISFAFALGSLEECKMLHSVLERYSEITIDELRTYLKIRISTLDSMKIDKETISLNLRCYQSAISIDIADDLLSIHPPVAKMLKENGINTVGALTEITYVELLSLIALNYRDAVHFTNKIRDRLKKLGLHFKGDSIDASIDDDVNNFPVEFMFSSTRILNVLKSSNIVVLGQIISLTKKEFCALCKKHNSQGLGKTSLATIEVALKEKGVFFKSSSTK